MAGLVAAVVGPFAVGTVALVVANTLDSAVAVVGMADSTVAGMVDSFAAGLDSPAVEDVGPGPAFPACYYQRSD